jgi:hypothetical protein
VRLPVRETIQFGWAKPDEDWEISFGVFVEDLDHAANEELLLFSRTCFPVVWLADSDSETLVSSPLLTLRFLLVRGIQMYVVLHGRELFHWP